MKKSVYLIASLMFLVLGLSLTVWLKNSKIDKLNEDVTALELKNKTLEGQAKEVIKKLEVIDTLDKIISEEISKSESSFDEIISELSYTIPVEEISPPYTPTNTIRAVQPTIKQSNPANLTSLWKAYCLAVDGDDVECQRRGY